MSGIALRDVSPQLHRAIKIGAAVKGLTMSQFVLEVLTAAPALKKAMRLAENESPKTSQFGKGEDDGTTGISDR